MFNKGSFPLIESRTLRGREGINLLVHACRSNSLFFFPYYYYFFLSFFFLSFLHACILFRGFLFKFLSPFLPLTPVHGQCPLFYSACHDWILLFQPLITFVWSGCTYRPPLVHLRWLCHSYHQIKKTILFVCLPWHPYLLRCGCSLSIPHGMHLVVPTYPYFFWMICHPSRTFPPKGPEQEPRNRFFFFLSPPPDHALLPLTYDFTTSRIGWVQAGDVQALRVLYFYTCSKLTCCLHACRDMETCLHILTAWVAF